MPESCTYFLTKSSVLVRRLFFSEGTSKDRLRDNQIEIFLVLSSPIPTDLHKQRDYILKRLTKKRESFSETILLMRQKTASNILKDFYDLYTEVKGRQVL